MPSGISITLNGRTLQVAEASSVAAAVMASGAAFRRSVTGEPRGPLCGMGICYECRLTIDGAGHQRSCQIICRPGMHVQTDAEGECS
ncbi:MAG TPA: 2Fe-2S iron-sulfur cluster-binding protein [Terriglobales bacterium]|nr:2Fe-2S iron-sulfur cluster-binding protein [Terriglobales bacterium]